MGQPTVSWASGYITKLMAGESVSFRPRGHSMTGRINSGQLCTVEPIGEKSPAVDEIVLCSVRGNHYLHLVKAVRGGQVQIGNNRGGINGWITPKQVFGRCIRVED